MFTVKSLVVEPVRVTVKAPVLEPDSEAVGSAVVMVTRGTVEAGPSVR